MIIERRPLPIMKRKRIMASDMAEKRERSSHEEKVKTRAKKKYRKGRGFLVETLIFLSHGNEIEGDPVKRQEHDDGLHGEHLVDRRIEKEHGRCKKREADHRVLRGENVTSRNTADEIAGGKPRQNKKDLDHGKFAKEPV